jgi:hypothetical protein
MWEAFLNGTALFLLLSVLAMVVYMLKPDL